MKRVAVYARVSTDDKGQNPENQLAQLRARCRNARYEIVDEYAICKPKNAPPSTLKRRTLRRARLRSRKHWPRIQTRSTRRRPISTRARARSPRRNACYPKSYPDFDRMARGSPRHAGPFSRVWNLSDRTGRTLSVLRELRCALSAGLSARSPVARLRGSAN